MNSPNLSPLQRYGPYIGICVLLALVLVIAPSQAPDRTNAFAGGFQNNSQVGTADQFSDAATGVGGATQSTLTPGATVPAGTQGTPGNAPATPGQTPALG